MSSNQNTEPQERTAAKPALPCPPWCTRKHSPADAACNHLRSAYDSADSLTARSYATLLLTDHGAGEPILARYNGKLRLHVTARTGENSPTFVIDLEDATGRQDARDLAALLSGLGHAALAAAITGLLDIADGAR